MYYHNTLDINGQPFEVRMRIVPRDPDAGHPGGPEIVEAVDEDGEYWEEFELLELV